MFLGDSSMSAKETYFLPLTGIWKKKALAGDKDAESKLKAAESLAKIQIMTASESFGLPKEARQMFSHGAYKLVLTAGGSGESIFAIRDIEGRSKDESGRAIPFLLVIAGTTPKDAIILEKVAAYAASHAESFGEELAGLFNYDADINGVSFHLSGLNALVKRIAEENSNSLLTLDGVMTIEVKPGAVSLLVLPEGISKETAVAEQGLNGKTVRAVPAANILPLDNKQKLIEMLKRIQDVKRSIYTDRRVQCLVGGAVALGFLLGFLIAKS